MIEELSEQNFDEKTKEGVKFVAFTAPWCGYCQKQIPVLNEIAQEDIWIGDVNSDNNQSLVQKYGISAFPSFILFKNGNVIGQFSGYHPKYELLNKMLSYLK
jgi:thioredoxin 1